MQSGSGNGRPRGSRAMWPEKQIVAVRRMIKESLDAVEASHGQDARLKAALEGVSTTSSQEDLESQLRCYIYIVSALVHHERFGGLRLSQIRELKKAAYAILQVRGIDLNTPRLAYLYGDLHQVLSQIYRKSGRQWESAWEQGVAAKLSKGHEHRGQGYQALALALRAARLGLGDTAYQNYLAAEEHASTPSMLHQARIGRIKMLRIMGKIQDSEELAGLTEANSKFADPALKGELIWESMCRDICRSGSLAKVVHAVRGRGSHYEGAYVLEARLWAMCVRSKEWMDRLQTMESLRRATRLHVTGFGALYEAAGIFESCYDSRYPLHYRIEQLGKVLEETSWLVSVDLELLVWLAAARWLARIHSFGLAAICLASYEALALRLTDGKSKDPLGLASDLMQSEWFQSRGTKLPAR